MYECTSLRMQACLEDEQATCGCGGLEAPWLNPMGFT